jgi:hypothetical protein
MERKRERKREGKGEGTRKREGGEGRRNGGERKRERGGEKTAGSAEQGGCGFWVGHNSSDCIFFSLDLSFSRSLTPHALSSLLV